MVNRPLRLTGVADSAIATALIAIALLLVLGSSLSDMWDAQAALAKTADQQEQALRANRKIERQLEALAKGTQGLANQGNANAAKIIAVLQQNGIDIKR